MNCDRVLIFGNTGSGKTYLARYLSIGSAIPLVSLDDIYWRDNNFRRARSTKWVSNQVLEISAKNRWIIEGTYSHLIRLALRRATYIIWLDMPTTDCLENIGIRETPVNQNTLKRAKQYQSRNTGTSQRSHNDIYSVFRRDKLRITSKSELSSLMDTRSTQ